MLPEPLQTVTLSVYDKKTGGRQSYNLKVVEQQDQYMVIQSPIQLLPDGVPLRKGTSVEIAYVYAGTMYVVETEVIKEIVDREPLLILRKPAPEAIQKIQRRQYLRVPTNINAKFFLNDRTKTYEVPLVDLSGGGFLAAVPQEVREQLSETVEGMLPVVVRNQQHIIPFKARVVKVAYNHDKKRYDVAFQFTEIKESDREVIIRYCFSRQLELHKKKV